jgi:hypothetical protein
MSHSRERKEKDCLNCGSMVEGRYCQVCGQENTEPKETFWHMFTHFFNDITHFDGKFFTTLKDLVIKPGFLSAEYMKGRRMSYLNPVRMYVFTSALFFLVFFSLRKPEDMVKLTDDSKPLTAFQRENKLKNVKRLLVYDSLNKNYLRRIALLIDTTRPLMQSTLDSLSDDDLPGISPYSSLAKYDSAQANLPEAKRDGWFKTQFSRRELKFKDEYQHNKKHAIEKMIDLFLHKLPYLLFASLPFFALILKLLYVRRRKTFYYADHGIFTIHHYVFSFILMLFTLLMSELNRLTHWSIWDIFIFIAIIAWPIHLYWAMRRFYGQRRFKTIVKFFMLNFLGLISLLLLFTIFAALSALEF